MSVVGPVQSIPAMKWRISPSQASFTGFVIGLLLLCLLGWEMHKHHGEEQRGAQSRSVASADMVAQWVDSTLIASAHSLRGIKELYDLTQTQPGSINADALATLLVRRRDSLEFWEEVALVSPSGRIIASTFSSSATHIELDQYDFFTPLLRPNAPVLEAISGLYASETASGDLRLLHALRLESPEGELQGLALARLHPSLFADMLERLTLNEGTSLGLVDAKPRVLARRAQAGTAASIALGTEVRTPQLLAFLSGSDIRGSWVRDSPVDGVHRLYSARKLENAPWVVIAGTDTAFYLNDWWRRFWALMAGWLALVVMGAVGMRHYRHLHAAEQELRQHRNRLAMEMETQLQAQQASELEAAQLKIAAMAFETHLGMFISDAENRIVQVNATFTTITGYAAEEVLGCNPRFLSSGRHDAAFYRTIWQRLKAKDSWQGEVWNRRKNGEIYPQWLTISVVRNDAGAIANYVATLSDITQRKAAEKEIHQLAFYDALTGLPNRRLLIDRLEAALKDTQRDGHYTAVMFIDLDNFKTINDSLGHYLGDALLQGVARRLEQIVRDGDTVARLGGDEFVVMLHELGGDLALAAPHAEIIANKLLMSLMAPFDVQEHVLQVTGSIGITLFTGRDVSVSDILQQADLAMYQAKFAGRNALRFFDTAMQALVVDRARLENDLRQALENQEFRLYYQSQVNAQGVVVGVEALLRWDHPVRGMVSPAEFIPLAEENNLITPIGAWVLKTACRQLALWARSPATEGLSIAVNVSPNQFRQAGFVEEVLNILAHTGANPHRLKLEVTESLFMEEVDTVRARMVTLRNEGICFSLDDFGTGYSSLAYLKRLPLDQLKIDQSFVRDVLDDPIDEAIVRTVIALAQSLELDVIAEGVETQAHRQWLYEHGCMAYQGYLFSRPVPIEALVLA
ncbi:EAL domain-containing protein [Vreelandella rituensis]|uniref:cyclic-guanylate-specific phosphodiesterase n=1 Tax=Vreelandella rituensis TaxID=2282306 RepID=A0A368U7F5_9GAMM|nr:EAL domain-containing protein [Halomonas rituensis]RCV92042.1 bifunctional diguanylate cyclase/phosphodiesterase [Halomonas rituensis]